MRFALLCALAMSAWAADRPQTGLFQLTFSACSPQSAWEQMSLRYGWSGSQAEKDTYRISEEPFDVNVPAEYDGSEAYGLVVYTNAGNGGNARLYAAALGPRKLIWIGATKVPNERSVFARWGLALDAVHNLSQRYRIDPRRVYAAGFSGGGRCASMTAPTFADVFTGGAIYFCGCNDPQWPASPKATPIDIKTLATTQRRYALMTGSGDSNLQDTKDVFAQYQGAGFKQVQLFEEPGLAHAHPSLVWFEKALDFVDAPVIAEANALLQQAQAFEAKKKPHEAFTAYRMITNEFPIAHEAVAAAKPRLEPLRAEVDALRRPDLEKLLAKPKADTLRDFAATWRDYPVALDAHSQAEALAQVDLEALIASGGASLPGKLAKFIDAWQGYTVVEAALIAYDGLAAKASESLAKAGEGERLAKAQIKFLSAWPAGGPTVERVRSALDGWLEGELARIQAIEAVPARAKQLVSFAKAWPGTPAAGQAEAELTALTEQAKAQQK